MNILRVFFTLGVIFLEYYFKKCRDTLILPEQYKDFISANCFTRECIFEFANRIKIAPGIVLGRLQKDNYVPYDWFNDLKVRYQIAC